MSRELRHALTLAALCLLPVLGAACKDKPPRPVAPKLTGPPPDSFLVAFETNRGRVVVEVHRAWAPHGVDHFYELLSDGFFDENRFFRVVPGFVAQFGVSDVKALNDKWEGTIPDDSVRLKNIHGTLTYAKDLPNSRAHQLFFNLDDNARLDKQGFAPIGRVVEGLAIVDSIFSGYGEMLSYQLILKQGSDYLKRFPKLDYIKTARVIPLMKVLFVGNSFTQRNNVPALIATLAEARGHTLEHRLISAGGASLKMHWNKGVAAQAIADTRYDYVMLQEQSTLPVKNAARMHENVRLFDEAIRASGATMALYLTWARAHAPESQQLITDAYQSIGQELDAVVAPAGIAWQRFLATHDRPVLHDKDQSHPTLAGSYLSACVIFATLFGENPVGVAMDLAGLTLRDIGALQQTAWDTVHG